MMLPTRILLLVSAIVTSAVIARALGPSGRGAVAVAFSLTLLLAQFGTFGITTANPFYLAREPGLRDRLVTNSVVLAVGLGGVCLLAGLLLRLVAPDAVRGLQTVDLLIALLGIPALLMAQFLQSLLLGDGRTVAYNAIELGVALATLAAIVAAALAGLTPRLALVILVAGRCAAAAAFLVAARRGTRWVPPDLGLARRMLGYGTRVYAATLLAFLVIRIDLLLVNAYRGSEAAGLYAVAVALADALYILPSVVAVNLFAHVARGAPDETSARAFRSVSLIYAAIVAAAALVAGPAITVIYGEQFEAAAPLFRWLAPGIFCLGMLNILAQHFAANGFPLEAVLVWIPGLALNIAVNLIFLPSGPTRIAAISSSLAYALLLVLHARMFARGAGGYSVLRPDVGEALALARRALARPRPGTGAA